MTCVVCVVCRDLVSSVSDGRDAVVMPLLEHHFRKSLQSCCGTHCVYFTKGQRFCDGIRRMLCCQSVSLLLSVAWDLLIQSAGCFFQLLEQKPVDAVIGSSSNEVGVVTTLYSLGRVLGELV